MEKTNASRREFMRLAFASAMSFGLPFPGYAKSNAKPTRPNILFIMADDHATNAISCYGSRLAQVAPTPNIDNLARKGMRLESCFCTNSICTPSRATIMTGKYSHKNGVYTLRDALDPAQPNVAKYLRKSGYQTALIGKWHLHSEPSGFDYYHVLDGQGRYFDPRFIENGNWEKEHRKKRGEIGKIYKGYSTDIVTDMAMKWMKGRNHKKPFFLMCHFKAPHEPWEYAKRYANYLADIEIPEPDSLWEDKSHRSQGSREYGYTIDTLTKRMLKKNYHSEGPIDIHGLNKKQQRKKTYQIFLKRYLRTIKGVDDNVGRLLKFLSRNNLAQNTVVIYTSDQGYFLGEHNYIDKRWIFEESLRMPFIVRYPAEIVSGSSNDDIVLNTDFAPTFLDYAGLPTPVDMQGRSMRPLLHGKTPSDWRTSMYYRYWMHTNRPAHYGLRTKRYKLIFFYGLPLGMSGASSVRTKPGWELYDLKNDPHELHNIYHESQYAEIIKELKRELLHKKKQLDDTDGKYPELLQLRMKTGGI